MTIFDILREEYEDAIKKENNKDKCTLNDKCPCLTYECPCSYSDEEDDSYDDWLDCLDEYFDNYCCCIDEIEPVKIKFYNNRATKVWWNDDTTTSVVCTENDKFDEDTGVMLCFLKKLFDNSSSYNNKFRKWIKKYGEHIFNSTKEDKKLDKLNKKSKIDTLKNKKMSNYK